MAEWIAFRENLEALLTSAEDLSGPKEGVEVLPRAGRAPE
jgi:hypothetical protein